MRVLLCLVALTAILASAQTVESMSQWIIKGDPIASSTKCDEDGIDMLCRPRLALDIESHAVRCVTTSAQNGFHQNSGAMCAKVWVSSKVWGQCTRLDLNDAKALCASYGARLPTRKEVENGCAAESDCGFNNDLIWTFPVTDPPTHLPTMSPLTERPTKSPVSTEPTQAPTHATGEPTNMPTPKPTAVPTITPCLDLQMKDGWDCIRYTTGFTAKAGETCDTWKEYCMSGIDMNRRAAHECCSATCDKENPELLSCDRQTVLPKCKDVQLVDGWDCLLTYANDKAGQTCSEWSQYCTSGNEQFRVAAEKCCSFTCNTCPFEEARPTCENVQGSKKSHGWDCIAAYGHGVSGKSCDEYRGHCTSSDAALQVPAQKCCAKDCDTCSQGVSPPTCKDVQLVNGWDCIHIFTDRKGYQCSYWGQYCNSGDSGYRDAARKCCAFTCNTCAESEKAPTCSNVQLVNKWDCIKTYSGSNNQKCDVYDRYCTSEIAEYRDAARKCCPASCNTCGEAASPPTCKNVQMVDGWDCIYLETGQDGDTCDDISQHCISDDAIFQRAARKCCAASCNTCSMSAKAPTCKDVQGTGGWDCIRDHSGGEVGFKCDFWKAHCQSTNTAYRDAAVKCCAASCNTCSEAVAVPPCSNVQLVKGWECIRTYSGLAGGKTCSEFETNCLSTNSMFKDAAEKCCPYSCNTCSAAAKPPTCKNVQLVHNWDCIETYTQSGPNYQCEYFDKYCTSSNSKYKAAARKCCPESCNSCDAAASPPTCKNVQLENNWDCIAMYTGGTSGYTCDTWKQYCWSDTPKYREAARKCCPYSCNSCEDAVKPPTCVDHQMVDNWDCIRDFSGGLAGYDCKYWDQYCTSDNELYQNAARKCCAATCNSCADAAPLPTCSNIQLENDWDCIAVYSNEHKKYSCEYFSQHCLSNNPEYQTAAQRCCSYDCNTCNVAATPPQCSNVQGTNGWDCIATYSGGSSGYTCKNWNHCTSNIDKFRKAAHKCCSAKCNTCDEIAKPPTCEDVQFKNKWDCIRDYSGGMAGYKCDYWNQYCESDNPQYRDAARKCCAFTCNSCRDTVKAPTCSNIQNVQNWDCINTFSGSMGYTCEYWDTYCLSTNEKYKLAAHRCCPASCNSCGEKATPPSCMNVQNQNGWDCIRDLAGVGGYTCESFNFCASSNQKFKDAAHRCCSRECDTCELSLAAPTCKDLQSKKPTQNEWDCIAAYSGSNGHDCAFWSKHCASTDTQYKEAAHRCCPASCNTCHMVVSPPTCKNAQMTNDWDCIYHYSGHSKYTCAYMDDYCESTNLNLKEAARKCCAASCNTCSEGVTPPKCQNVQFKSNWDCIRGIAGLENYSCLNFDGYCTSSNAQYKEAANKCCAASCNTCHLSLAPPTCKDKQFQKDWDCIKAYSGLSKMTCTAMSRYCISSNGKYQEAAQKCCAATCNTCHQTATAPACENTQMVNGWDCIYQHSGVEKQECSTFNSCASANPKFKEAAQKCCAASCNTCAMAEAGPVCKNVQGVDDWDCILETAGWKGKTCADMSAYCDSSVSQYKLSANKCCPATCNTCQMELTAPTCRNVQGVKDWDCIGEHSTRSGFTCETFTDYCISEIDEWKTAAQKCCAASCNTCVMAVEPPKCDNVQMQGGWDCIKHYSGEANRKCSDFNFCTSTDPKLSGAAVRCCSAKCNTCEDIAKPPKTLQDAVFVQQPARGLGDRPAVQGLALLGLLAAARLAYGHCCDRTKGYEEIQDRA